MGARAHPSPLAQRGRGVGHPPDRGGIMVYRGTIKGGVVVLPVDITLPEGTEVLVALPDQGAESVAGPVIRESSAEFGRSAGTWPTHLPPVLAADPSKGADHPAAQAGPP